MLIFKGVCFWCPNTSSPTVGKGNIYPSAYLRVWVLPTPKTIGSRTVNVCSLVKRQIFCNQKKQNQPTKKDSALCRSSECGGKDLSLVGLDQSFVFFVGCLRLRFFRISFTAVMWVSTNFEDVNQLGRSRSVWNLKWLQGIDLFSPHICSESACLLIFVDIEDSWVAFQPKGDHAGPRPWDQTLTNSPLSYMNHQEGRQKQQRLPRNHLNELLPQFLRKRWGQQF